MMFSTNADRTFGTGRPDRAGGVDRSDAETLRRLSKLASLLDDRYRIPGTNWRFGLDAVIGLVPGIGDLSTAAISTYIMMEGKRLGVPKRVLIKMAKNIAVDVAVGAIPLVGDLADVHWKANRKNVRLLMQHVERARGERAQFAVS